MRFRSQGTAFRLAGSDVGTPQAYAQVKGISLREVGGGGGGLVRIGGGDERRGAALLLRHAPLREAPAPPDFDDDVPVRCDLFDGAST
jgi:hypothetical protein